MRRRRWRGRRSKTPTNTLTRGKKFRHRSARSASSAQHTPCAIMAGMTAASLVTGNTVVLKPASDSPTIAAKFIDILFEAGIPKEAVNFITGPGGAVGDTLVQHPKTRYIGFTGSKEVGLRISQLAGKTTPRPTRINPTVPEMGGKDGIVVDEEADIDAAVER